MTDYVFIGRQRRPWLVLVLGLITLGIYGRVLLAKLVKEIDGHRALFIDQRVTRILLVLPIVGPWFVKRHVRHLLDTTLEADVTQPPAPMRSMFWLAWIPIVPAMAALAHARLNPYWHRQERIEEIRHRREALERLQKGRANQARQDQIRTLEQQIQRRETALADEEAAAIALRDARAESRRLEGEHGSLLHRARNAAADKIKQAVPKRAEGTPSLRERLKERIPKRGEKSDEPKSKSKPKSKPEKSGGSAKAKSDKSPEGQD